MDLIIKNDPYVLIARCTRVLRKYIDQALPWIDKNVRQSIVGTIEVPIITEDGVLQTAQKVVGHTVDLTTTVAELPIAKVVEVYCTKLNNHILEEIYPQRKAKIVQFIDASIQGYTIEQILAQRNYILDIAGKKMPQILIEAHKDGAMQVVLSLLEYGNSVRRKQELKSYQDSKVWETLIKGILNTSPNDLKSQCVESIDEYVQGLQASISTTENYSSRDPVVTTQFYDNTQALGSDNGTLYALEE